MPPRSIEFTDAEARQRLGLDVDAPLSELQGAFQRALTHSRGPDDHVPAELYREILEAYRFLRSADPTPGEARRFEVWPSQIELTPTEATLGGMKVGRLPNGRPFETKIPSALRDGDLVWVWGWLLQARIDVGGDLEIRGDDIWINARKHPWHLKPGSRIGVETPLGPCSFRLSAEAVNAGLVRAPGLGLPPSRGHAQGDLYVRLIADRRAGVAPEILYRLMPPRAA